MGMDMARYKLMGRLPEDNEEEEILGQRKTTRADVDQWCEDNINALGLDWRVGYLIKFKRCDCVYRWAWIKTGKDVKCSK
jgi:hypothetical protein